MRGSRGWSRSACAAVVAVAALALGAAPAAAAPANDDRADAQRLAAPPVTVSGTTVDATLEPNEPGSCQGNTAGSVWYRFTTAQSRDVVVALRAQGDMDAVVDVYVRVRSQAEPVACDRTDRAGEALVDFDARGGTEYLVRVAPLANSVAEDFSLRVLLPRPPARPPGRALPLKGRGGTLDRIVNPDDAWWVRLRAGRTYRVNFVSARGRCSNLTIFAPGLRSFSSGDVVREMSCDGYRLITPRVGQSGRFVLRVSAPRSARGSLRYRVQVAPARADDTAPGRFIPNHGRLRNRLRGNRVDVVDLYRFDVVTRSDLTLTLDARSFSAFDLVLLNYGGRRLRCACGSSGSQVITTRVRPGRYFAAVRARNGTRGRYALRRLSRTITSAATRVNGVRFGTAAPGASLRVTVDITPAVSGPVTIVVERFDPLAGWQFAAQRNVRAIAGRATLSYRPPRLGRWRFIATFDGTRTASPSVAPVARVLVAGPLKE